MCVCVCVCVYVSYDNAGPDLARGKPLISGPAIMAKLRSTYDGRLIYETSYESRQTQSLAKS